MSDAALLAQLAHEDAGIERAAIALCFAARPVLTTGPIPEISARAWWRQQPEITQRVYLYRARVAVVAWEDFNAVIE